VQSDYERTLVKGTFLDIIISIIIMYKLFVYRPNTLSSGESKMGTGIAIQMEGFYPSFGTLMES